MKDDLKVALLTPLIKKPNADFELFSDFRPVSNLKFLSKLIEKSAYLQLNKYLNLHEPLQSAYKVCHSRETFCPSYHHRRHIAVFRYRRERLPGTFRSIGSV